MCIIRGKNYGRDQHLDLHSYDSDCLFLSIGVLRTILIVIGISFHLEDAVLLA